MSFEAYTWATNEAMDANGPQLLVLQALANVADTQGRGAALLVREIAPRARTSVRSVHRRLTELLELGLIVHGDQELVSHLPADKRPIVYDLAMPAKATPERYAKLARRGMPAVARRGVPRLSPRDMPPVTPRDMSAVADIDSLKSKTESTATAAAATPTAPTSPPAVLGREQQQQNPLDEHPPGHDHDHAGGLDALVDAMDAAGFHGLSWRGLTDAEMDEIDALEHAHGVEGLVKLAIGAAKAHTTPAQHVRAPLATWRAARPPRKATPTPDAQRTPCAVHPEHPAAACPPCEDLRGVVPTNWRSRATAAATT